MNFPSFSHEIVFQALATYARCLKQGSQNSTPDAGGPGAIIGNLLVIFDVFHGVFDDFHGYFDGFHGYFEYLCGEF
jgi:hypothetical protein